MDDEKVVDTDTAKKQAIKDFRTAMDKAAELISKINPRLAKDAEDATKNPIRPNR
jgi:hypothetical protein